jgi:[calcium/calmodulin-dependent protein kinase] kinase
MSGGRALIADFGVSLIVGDHDLLDNTQGTYHFMPPEACDKDQVKKGYSGKSADVWALGVTFYCFIYLQVPFTGDNLIEILSNISEAKYINTLTLVCGSLTSHRYLLLWSNSSVTA